MSRFEDYGTSPEVRDIVDGFVKKFPRVFEGFMADDVFFIVTKKKKPSGRFPIRVRAIPYPYYVSSGQAYVFETFETKWEKMTKKQKNLAVFHAMCAVPVGGFDPASKKYGKIVKPDFEIYRYEYAVSGGVPDWMEDDKDLARDPMEVNAEEVRVETEEGEEDPIPPSGSSRKPVTAGDIAGSDEEDAA